jgi:hypothetical protein
MSIQLFTHSPEVDSAIDLAPRRRSRRVQNKKAQAKPVSLTLQKKRDLQDERIQDLVTRKNKTASFSLPAASFQSPVKTTKSEDVVQTPTSSSSSVTSSSVSPTSARQIKVRQILQDNPTPEKTYNLSEQEDGWIRLNLTPGVKKATRVIYMFREKSTGKTLVGKTETTVSKRTSGYTSQINHPEKKRGQMPLPTAVRENPDDFEFGILCKAPDDIDLDALEQAYIGLKKSVTHGFNQRNGGGGGRARKKSKENQDPERVKTVTKNLLEQFQSPQKKPVKKTRKGYSVPLSPTTKKTKNVIYVFKNIQTGERYVGKTIRALNKRISEHMHHAAHPEKDAGKLPLQKAIRKNHKDISVGVLYRVPKEEEDLIDEIEKSFIEYYQSSETGYNGNKGGGGG